MDKELIELQREYLKALPEKLDQIYELVLNLEKGKNFKESLTYLKGIIHSIKGSAGSYEISFLSEVCHKFEDQLDDLEDGKSDTSKSFLFIELIRGYLDFFNPGELSDNSEFEQKLNTLTSNKTDLNLSEKKTDGQKNILVISFDKFISDGVRLSLTKFKTLLTFIQDKNEIKNLGRDVKYDQLFIDESAQEFLSSISNWEEDGILKKNSKIFFITSSEVLKFPDKKIIPIIKSHLLLRNLQIAFQKDIEIIKEAPKKILLVDDDESIHPIFKKAFKNSKEIEIITKSSSKEALQILDIGGIDLLILDLMMPEINGVEVFKILKEKKNQIPVIFLTGISKPAEIKELIDLGAKGVISKPFKMGNLAGQIMEIWSKF